MKVKRERERVRVFIKYFGVEQCIRDVLLEFLSEMRTRMTEQ